MLLFGFLYQRVISVLEFIEDFACRLTLGFQRGMHEVQQIVQKLGFPVEED